MPGYKIRALWKGEYFYFRNLMDFEKWVGELKTDSFCTRST